MQKYCELPNELPRNGIYLFYEEGERCAHTDKSRIVRVGTHGAKRTLRSRMLEHYNRNREAISFRKYLGVALLQKNGIADEEITEWQKRRNQSTRWEELRGTETEVDTLIRTKFCFRVIPMENVEERKVFEKKLIASLANCPLCRPSDNWLGHFARNAKVRRSGLWNHNYVDSDEQMCVTDIERLEQLVIQ